MLAKCHSSFKPLQTQSLKNVQATNTCTTLTLKHTKPSESRHQRMSW